MGRPRKTLTQKEIGQIETLAAVATVEQIADFLGVSRQTFYAIMKRNKKVSRLYKKGRASASIGVGMNLVAQARNGNLTAQIFYLKTQCGWKEQADVPVEIDHEVTINIAPITAEDVEGLKD